MSDIEQKALALVNEMAIEECEEVNLAPHKTLCAALRLSVERHESFRQKVSDAAEVYEEMGYPMAWEGFEQFIIRKPDPLVKVLNEISHEGGFDNFNHYAHRLRAALDALGFEIKEKSK